MRALPLTSLGKSNPNSQPDPVPDSAPAEDWVSWNYNRKYDQGTAYLDFLNATVPSAFGWGYREALYGAPGSNSASPRPSYQAAFTNGGLKWFSDLKAASNTWTKNKKLITEIDASKVWEGSGTGFFADGPAGSNAYGDNVAWRTNQILQYGPETDLWLSPSNEVDLTGRSSSGSFYVKDNPADTRSAALDRVLLATRVIYNELRCNGAKYNQTPSPKPILGPTTAFATQTTLSIQSFCLKDLLTWNNASFLKYVDGLSHHYHNVHSYRENFQGTSSPGSTTNCPFHAWKSIAAAREIDGSIPLKPVCVTEMGIQWTQHTGGWGSLPYALKAFKTSQSMLYSMWWGLSMISGYCWAYSPDTPMNIYQATSPFNAYADNGWMTPAQAWNIAWDYTRYPYRATLAVPSKSWNSYHDPADGAVMIDMGRDVTATAPACPFPEWSRVTMDGNYITASGGGRNTICFPMWLNDRSTRTFAVDVTVAGGGTARVVARGHDKLDGLADPGQSQAASKSTSATEKTIAVTFTPRGHGVSGLANPNYVLLALDHDGTGTAKFRNMRFV